MIMIIIIIVIMIKIIIIIKQFTLAISNTDTSKCLLIKNAIQCIFFIFMHFSTLKLLISHSNFSVTRKFTLRHQGPVVQSIVNLTSSVRGQLVECFMTL